MSNNVKTLMLLALSATVLSTTVGCEKVEELTKDAKAKTEDVMKDAKKMAGKVQDKTEDAMKDAKKIAGKVQEKTEDAMKDAKQMAEKAKSKTEDAIKDVKNEDVLEHSKQSSPSSVGKEAVAAAKKGDVAAFKACFTPKIAKRLDDETAPMVMDMLKDVKIGAETMDGDKGTIEMTWKGRTKKMPCVKENGEWKLSE